MDCRRHVLLNSRITIVIRHSFLLAAEKPKNLAPLQQNIPGRRNHGSPQSNPTPPPEKLLRMQLLTPGRWTFPVSRLVPRCRGSSGLSVRRNTRRGPSMLAVSGPILCRCGGGCSGPLSSSDNLQGPRSSELRARAKACEQLTQCHDTEWRTVQRHFENHIFLLCLLENTMSERCRISVPSPPAT